MAELHVEATITLTDTEEQVLDSFGDTTELIEAVVDAARASCGVRPGKNCEAQVCFDDNSGFAVNDEFRVSCGREFGCDDPENVARAGMDLIARLDSAHVAASIAVEKALVGNSQD